MITSRRQQPLYNFSSRYQNRLIKARILGLNGFRRFAFFFVEHCLRMGTAWPAGHSHSQTSEAIMDRMQNYHASMLRSDSRGPNCSSHNCTGNGASGKERDQYPDFVEHELSVNESRCLTTRRETLIIRFHATSCKPH